MRYSFLISAALCLLTSPVWADDTVEAAVTGNIVFERVPGLIMQDETLTISKKSSHQFGAEKFSIDVDFHFKNISDHDITQKISFIFPPVHCRLDNNTLWRGLEHHQYDDNGLKDLTGSVDNQPITFTKRHEAKLGNQLITDLLIKNHIPLNPCQIKIGKNNKPDIKYRAALEKHHLLTEDNVPAWDENIYFEWTQTFPAGKVVNIHHHYTPVIGEAVPAPYTIEEINNWFTHEDEVQDTIWNRDLATLATTNQAIVSKNKEDNELRFCVTPMWVRYRLTAGVNWQGDIGTFKLIIHDENHAPFAVNQFYKSDKTVQKSISQNNMTITIKNFVPKQDLLVLFLSLPQNPSDFQSCGIERNG